LHLKPHIIYIPSLQNGETYHNVQQKQINEATAATEIFDVVVVRNYLLNLW
jgi:hypothetical protein